MLSILKQSFHLPFKTNLCPFCSDSLNPVYLNLLPYNTFEDLLFYLKPNTYSKLNLFVCLTLNLCRYLNLLPLLDDAKIGMISLSAIFLNAKLWK